MRQASVCSITKYCYRPLASLRTDLGSASLATNAEGSVVAELRYTPYGEIGRAACPRIAGILDNVKRSG